MICPQKMTRLCVYEEEKYKLQRKKKYYLAIITPETPVSCLCRCTSSHERRSPFPVVKKESVFHATKVQHY